MDAQAAGSLAEALRYTPGITAELCGTDKRGYGIKSAASMPTRTASTGTGCS